MTAKAVTAVRPGRGGGAGGGSGSSLRLYSLMASAVTIPAPTRKITATTASTIRGASRWNTTVPSVVAITTCTRKAPAEPSQTANGCPQVDITSAATMVLSGSSPTK